MANQLPPSQTLLVKDTGDVKIHTFISPSAFLANATHIIETPKSLIVVDGQFVVPFAMEFRALVDSLQKPIARVYLSHEHPDHWFGLGAAFNDTDIYALPATIDFLKSYGEAVREELAQGYGDFVTKVVPVPQHEVDAGFIEIDGVRLEHVVIDNTESDHMLTINMPDFGVCIAQDTIYSGAHLYLTHNFDHWVDVLQGYLDSDNELFLAGHGLPADNAEVRANIEYLQTAQNLLNSGASQESLKASLLATYPDRTGEGVFDIYLPRLFSANDSGKV